MRATLRCSLPRPWPPRHAWSRWSLDWKWALVAKRFVWQATQGDKLKPVRCCLVKRLTAVSGMFACVQFHLQDVGDMQHQGVCIIMSIRSICGDCFVQPDERIASVDVRWGDALKALPGSFTGGGQQIELLFLDGCCPAQYLAYLRAAEPVLAPGALVVAGQCGRFCPGRPEGVPGVCENEQQVHE